MSVLTHPPFNLISHSYNITASYYIGYSLIALSLFLLLWPLNADIQKRVALYVRLSDVILTVLWKLLLREGSLNLSQKKNTCGLCLNSPGVDGFTAGDCAILVLLVRSCFVEEGAARLQ
jgi:hypothetical protein